ELEIVQRMGVHPPHANRVLELDDLIRLQATADTVFAHRAIMDYAVRIVHATWVPVEYNVEELAGLITYGASPRASLGLVAGARALALLRGRDYVLPVDVVDIAPDVLRHRLVLSYEALADNVAVDHLIKQVLDAVPAPRLAPSQDPTAGVPVSSLGAASTAAGAVGTAAGAAAGAAANPPPPATGRQDRPA
ncbi:MAG: MoxR family ATPase, partial [Actinobacteria bacterium]|nr:MoxR family ATPase [Actinomycetota bacterium]